MQVRAQDETPIKPSPFNPNAKWLRPQWYGDVLMSVEVEVADLIYSFIRAVKPLTVLETGTWKGFSTRAIAHALKYNKSGVVTTVDILDRKYVPLVLNQGKTDKHIDGSPTFEKIEGDIFNVLPKMIKENKKFNVIFCDDWHQADHVKKELKLFEQLITKPGYILFHDTYFTAMGDIGKTVRDWAKEKGYDHLPCYTSRGFDIVHVK